MNRNPANMANLSADNLVEIALKGDAQHREYARRNIREWFNSFTKETELGAILINPNFHISYAPSNVWDMPWERVDGTLPKVIDFVESDWSKNFITAHERGIEPYSLAIEEGKKQGVEMWFTIRMNEYHFINRWEYSCSSLWVNRPDLRIDNAEPFDFAKEEVREYYLEYIKDLCRNYDIDGIELDFWRGFDYFKPPVTKEKADILTDFVKSVREALDVIGKEKSKYLKMSARTHAYPEQADAKGWDTAKWIKEGYIDIITLANFFLPVVYDAQVEKWREKIEALGVRREDYLLNVSCELAVFCILYNKKETRWKTVNTTDLKGFAANYISMGADGIYTFNVTNKDYSLPREERLVDYSIITSKTEIYKGERGHILTCIDNYDDYFAKPYKNGEARDFEIYTSKAPQRGSYTVIVGANQENPNIRIFVNGCQCRDIGTLEGEPYDAERDYPAVSETSQAAKWMEKYDLPDLSRAKSGYNVITIKSEDENPVEITWLEVRINSL